MVQLQPTPMPCVTQLGYVRFGVSDLARWRSYAADILGFMECAVGKADEIYYRIDGYNYRFIIAPTGEDDITLAGWEVKDEAALKAISARLESMGFEVTPGTEAECDERMVLGLSRYKDPDGIENELYFGPMIHQMPFVSSQVASGFKAGSLGLGHIVRAVDDQASYLRYLSEGLGAKLSDFMTVQMGDIKVRAIFTHVNQRHHTIALAPFRPAMGDMPAGKRIDHFMVELNSLDDVGYALDRYRSSGLAVGELGKHTNDHMISFYGMTPSGFSVEYGTGGLLIENEDEWEVANYEAFSFWGHTGSPH